MARRIAFSWRLCEMYHSRGRPAGNRFFGSVTWAWDAGTGNGKVIVRVLAAVIGDLQECRDPPGL
ncbi:hypothetical protein GCM10012287_40240 [Streptomyces daqingensis]|uniref:Uncharacterized protein n=1 Tax=Streptomyces daqingensis TaxID=1472640 RepID=A0ABQ2ML03_9ACTN|nr:hypothetical protein GCM10012287_40240 [Streptomyces daqingensis]